MDQIRESFKTVKQPRHKARDGEEEEQAEARTDEQVPILKREVKLDQIGKHRDAWTEGKRFHLKRDGQVDQIGKSVKSMEAAKRLDIRQEV